MDWLQFALGAIVSLPTVFILGWQIKGLLNLDTKTQINLAVALMISSLSCLLAIGKLAEDNNDLLFSTIAYLLGLAASYAASQYVGEEDNGEY
jgi:hypothetical protein